MADILGKLARPNPIDVLASLDRIRAHPRGDAMFDELCSTLVSWGPWRKAAIVSPSPGAAAIGSSGLSIDERTALRRLAEATTPASAAEFKDRSLTAHRLAAGVDAARVFAEAEGDGLRSPLAEHAGDAVVLLPSRADGSPLGLLWLADGDATQRSADSDELEAVRLALALASCAGRILDERRDATGAAQDEARRVLALVEDLNGIDDTQTLLDRIAEASATLSGYRVAVLSVYLPEGALLGAHELSEEERALFHRSMATTPLERRLAKRQRIRAFAFPGTSISFVPHTADLARSPAFCASGSVSEGTWHPEDRLFILVRTGTGKEIGVLSLDEPLDGNAPSVGRLSRLRVVERLLELGGTLLYNRVLARDLRRSEEAHRALVDGAPVGIYCRGDDRGFLSANPRLAEIFGYESAEALVADATFAERLGPAVGRAPEPGVEAEGEVIGSDVRAVRLDGTPIRLRVTTRRDPERGEEHGIVEDVTEARHLEEHLQRTQRVEALGTLASGVAHDFNNLLAGILGYAALLHQRLEGSEGLAGMAKSIQDSALRAADLTRRLLGIARPGPSAALHAELGPLLADCARIARETFDRRIVVRVEVPQALPAALADGNEVHRAVLNLCINARDAMPEGGVLTLVAAEDVAGPRSTPAVAGASRGERWLRIDVRDTGTGMDEGVRARIFEPFFTTKPRGKGTGLGLYTVFQAAKAYGGAVEVDSRLTEGACFHLYLPAAPSVVAGVPCRPTEAVLPAGVRRTRAGRVLVVEDEFHVRRLASHVLRSAGHTVGEAEDGLEAVALFAGTPDDWDVVLLDLQLPRLSGLDVFRRMRALRPGVLVLLSSGNVHDGLDDAELREGVAGVLPKPYLPSDLLGAVERILARAR